MLPLLGLAAAAVSALTAGQACILGAAVGAGTALGIGAAKGEGEREYPRKRQPDNEDGGLSDEEIERAAKIALRILKK
jgi:hypothetical protein